LLCIMMYIHPEIKYPSIHKREVCSLPKLYPTSAAYKRAEFAPLPTMAKGKEAANECTGVLEIFTKPAAGSPAYIHPEKAPLTSARTSSSTPTFDGASCGDLLPLQGDLFNFGSALVIDADSAVLSLQRWFELEMRCSLQSCNDATVSRSFLAESGRTPMSMVACGWSDVGQHTRVRVQLLRETLTRMGGIKGIQRLLVDTILVQIFHMDVRLHVPDPELFEDFVSAAHKGNLKQLESLSRRLQHFSWAPFFRGARERDQMTPGTRGQLVAAKWYKECIRRDPTNVECIFAQSGVVSRSQRVELWRHGMRIFPGLKYRVLDPRVSTEESRISALSMYLDFA